MPIEKPRFTPCDTDALTQSLTRDVIDTRARFNQKEERLKQVFADLDECGIPTEIIKSVVWQYAVEFTRLNILEMIKRNETEALNIGASPVTNLLTPKHKDLR